MEAASLSPDDDELVKKLALMDMSAVIGYQILYDELISKVTTNLMRGTNRYLLTIELGPSA